MSNWRDRALEILNTPEVHKDQKVHVSPPGPIGPIGTWRSEPGYKEIDVSDLEGQTANNKPRAGVPRAWTDGFTKMCAVNQPGGFPALRWARIIDDTGHFIDRWAKQAHALGWSALDVFGVNKDAPAARFDGRGLAVSLNGRQVVAITASTATVTASSGGTLKFLRRTTCGPDERVLVWQLRENINHA